MSTKAKPKTAGAIPIIEEIKLSDLATDLALSGRTAKEIKTNAKLLAPTMAAFGGWDARQPGEYFERDGKKHLSAGFTRAAAAAEAGFKTGYFVKVEDDPAALRTACIRTNLGRPISQYEQGRIYTAMRDGGDPTKAKKGETVLAPMSTKDIGEEIGVSRQHIENCIAIFTETPEIAELIVAGSVSPNIAVRAKQLVKADGKRLAFLKAAVKLAASEGKETATMKHLDKVKPDYVPLKAATTGKDGKDGKGSKTGKDDAKGTKGGKDGGKTGDGGGTDGKGAQSSLELGSTDSNGGKTEQTQREAYVAAINQWGADRSVEFSETDVEVLIDALIALPF